jgi:predicted amidophosphoribosyltransferase
VFGCVPAGLAGSWPTSVSSSTWWQYPGTSFITQLTHVVRFMIPARCMSCCFVTLTTRGLECCGCIAQLSMAPLEEGLCTAVCNEAASDTGSRSLRMFQRHPILDFILNVLEMSAPVEH